MQMAYWCITNCLERRRKVVSGRDLWHMSFRIIEIEPSLSLRHLRSQAVTCCLGKGSYSEAVFKEEDDNNTNT